MLKKLLRWRSRRHSRRMTADRLREMADQMRAAARYQDAGVLYAASIDFLAHPGARVQAGHMFKEAGNWGLAEEHYLAALAALPADPDLALQLGHFYKVAGRPTEAVRWYRRAAELQPDWAEPLRELDGLGAGLTDKIAVTEEGAISTLPWRRPPAEFAEPLDIVVFRHFGSPPAYGEPKALPVLKGVESIRGICVSAASLGRAELLVDGVVVASAAAVRVERLAGGGDKHVFNIWHDFTVTDPGVRTVEVRIADDAGTVRRARREAFIGTTLTEATYPDSDGVVDPPVGSAVTLDEWINRRPSMVRPARSRYFTQPPRCIMVVRADQLGDMVVSVPALRRLRALVPAAKIVGLVTPANADLARSLGLFDVVETMHWDPTAPTGVRRLTLAEEQRLGVALRAHQPEVAIDLLVSGVSRPLLALSGASFTMGFEDSAWPFLTADLSGRTHDARNGHEMGPHAARLLMLVERFGTLLDGGNTTLPLAPAEASQIEALGLQPRRYAVLHAGGRFIFSRWPGYVELAERLLDHTDLSLVVLDQGGVMPASLRGDPRVRVIEHEMPFAQFDALLGFGAVFVGNDSGPKHLASLRGTPVVSVHSARMDWREWGQTQTGLVVSRRIPCAGCTLHADQENECGRDYACINDIGVDEVFAAVMTQLA